MRLRSFIALTLCLGLQTSLCTGGALATLSGLSDFFAYQSIQFAPMSYGSIGYLSCKDNKVADVRSVDSNCGDASDCLLQAFHYTKDQSLASVQSLYDVWYSTAHGSKHNSPVILKSKHMLARAGPLYEDAHSLSHSLLKRE